MPTYVYGCGNGHEKEVIHSVTDDPNIICYCGELMHRVPQPFMFYSDPIHSFDKFIDDGYEKMMTRRSVR